MKKLVSVSVFIVAILFQFVFATNAKAQDTWCYTDANGFEYYAMTEATKYIVGGQIDGYVKRVYPDKSKYEILEWTFGFDEGVCWANCHTNPLFTPKGRRARNSPLALSIVRCLYYYKYGKYHPYID